MKGMSHNGCGVKQLLRSYVERYRQRHRELRGLATAKLRLRSLSPPRSQIEIVRCRLEILCTMAAGWNRGEVISSLLGYFRATFRLEGAPRWERIWRTRSGAGALGENRLAEVKRGFVRVARGPSARD